MAEPWTVISRSVAGAVSRLGARRPWGRAGAVLGEGRWRRRERQKGYERGGQGCGIVSSSAPVLPGPYRLIPGHMFGRTEYKYERFSLQLRCLRSQTRWTVE
jgi:hypothetical protein